MNQRWRITFLLLLAASGLLNQIRAQSTALLRGKIVDASGSPVAGAQIKAIEEGTDHAVSATSGPDGGFSFSLQPGKYTLRISKENFSEGSRSVEVTANGTEVPDITLSVEPVNTTVEVSDNAGYVALFTATATKTLTPLLDVPQSVTVVTRDLIQDQMMMSINDVVAYVPGVTSHQGENNRDELIMRGNDSSANFYLNGVRDDVQYYRDLYNIDRVEVLKGPNALIFGRGDSGGVVNRVTKEAGFTPLREITLDGGSFGDIRAAVDLDQPAGDKVALRLNGVYQHSDSFRDFVGLERYGVNPTVTIAPSKDTKITFSYENFQDYRGSDRGIPSFQGLPVDLPVNQFFGNPAYNDVWADVNIGTATIEHQAGSLNIRNRFSAADYDRGYQNFVPGAVTADGLQDSLSAYNNATQRRNYFNQTDLTYTFFTGTIHHTLVGGTELGRQLTNNLRNTGFFNGTDLTMLIPLSDTVIDTPTSFIHRTTDAFNHLETNLGAIYVQDQVEMTKRIQLVGGLRFDYFDLQFHDKNTGNNLRRIDHLVSPRAGIIYKPVSSVSVYGSYSVSYLPSSGDQFSSLTVITEQVKPEKFTNYEVGAKWDFSRRFSLTTAVYRLDRTNTRSIDPNDPTRIVQTGSQRTNGFEIGVNGHITRAWQVAGGYAYQDAFVTSATTAAKAGAQVAQVPHNTFSLWNNYQFFPRFSAGLGILNRSDMFAAIDNTVVLPGYVRLDAGLFYSLAEHARLQLNVENLTDRKYFLDADNNNNISPGSPRAFLAGLVMRF